MNEHTKFRMARQVSDLANAEKRQPRGLTERIVRRAIGDLKQFLNIPGAFPAFVPRNDIWPEGIRAGPFEGDTR
jgi:hypothetical protein